MRIDLTSHLILAAGRQFGQPTLNAGATFRTNATMGQYGMSCQFYQPPEIQYMHPGLNPYVAGVGRHWWANSKSCGQCIKITNTHNNKSGLAIIADYCPECTPRQLDLGDKVSRKLSSHDKPENYGAWLKVENVECDWQPAQQPTFAVHKDSSAWHWYVIPQFLSAPLKSITIENQQASHDNYGRWVWAWRAPKPAKTYEAKICTIKDECTTTTIQFHYKTPKQDL